MLAANANAQGGGGGEGEKAAAPAAASNSASPTNGISTPNSIFGQNCRWSDHQSRLTSYTAKIRSFEKEIEDMIATKHHVDRPDQLKVLTQQIAFKYKDLQKTVKDYETERLHVRFQHPDRDLDTDREYPAQKLKSLEEIETAFGLDGRLDRIKRQVEIVLPVATPVEETAKRGVASDAKEDDDDKPETIHLVK